MPIHKKRYYSKKRKGSYRSDYDKHKSKSHRGYYYGKSSRGFKRAMGRGWSTKAVTRPIYYKDAQQNHNVNSAGTITYINDMKQGSAHDSRTGNEVVLHSYAFNYRILPDPGTGVLQSCRFMLVYDRFPSGAVPAFTDILATKHVCGLYNVNNSWRFKILWDTGAFWLGDARATYPGTAPGGITLSKYIKLGDRIARYTANNGVIGDCKYGSLLLLTLGTEAAGTTDSASDGYGRLRWSNP